MTHRLKTWPEYFQAILEGKKTFEVRVNDRDFKVGDELVLEEWEPVVPSARTRRMRIEESGYTGRRIQATVSYILPLKNLPGSDTHTAYYRNLVVMSLANIENK